VPLYPLRFEPIFKPAIWGGRRLADMFPGAPAEGPIGEAWILSDHGDDVSVVADGPLKGTTLRELMRDRREELLGPSLVHHEAFPLLLKVIDARENLSVQVHPDDSLAKSLAGVPRGKTEAWVVLHAEPGSRIYAGLKEGVDRPRLERAIADGTVADCLHSFEPTVGDCVYLPAGTVHALGGGITIFEVQQTSDTTYRLFDWNRVDAKTGKARDLHIGQALECIDFARGPARPGIDVLRRQCPYFSLHVIYLKNPPCILDRVPNFRIMLPRRGTALFASGGRSVQAGPYEAVLVPASADLEITGYDLPFFEIRPK
jgi:mannose-6-phosphate isomerase